MSRNRCDLYQVLKVVGEREVQVVERVACAVPDCCGPVEKVLQVRVDVTGTADTLFTNKVVKEGVFDAGILFADSSGFVRFVSTQAPFIVEAEIPGALPGMQAENRLVAVEETAAVVERRPEPDVICEVIEIKIVARFLVKVTVLVQQQLMKCCDHRPRRSQASYSFYGYSTCRGY